VQQNRQRRRRPAEDARQHLMAAAERTLLGAQGRMEIAAVVAEAGTTTGAVYHHFGSRAGLLRALLDEVYDRLYADILLPQMPGETWSERERERIRRLVEAAYREPLAPLLLGLTVREPDVALADSERTARLSALAAQNLRRAQAEGEVRRDVDPDVTGAVIMGGLRQALGQALTAPRRPPAAQLAEDLWRVIERLAADSTAPGRP
jgi:AcrR family transcriptional regulator